jgi:hypothetical protein
MNVRDASEHLALGNRISSLFVDLPVDEPELGERIRAIAPREKLHLFSADGRKRIDI